MSVDRIADMTYQELEEFVIGVVDRRYSWGWRTQSIQLGDKPDLKALLASMRANIIQTKPGEPSPTQLLKEDRDRWYKP